MRSFFCVLLLVSVCLAQRGRRSPRTPASRAPSATNGVRTSALSSSLARDLAPGLEADFRAAGLQWGGRIFIRVHKFSDQAKFEKYIAELQSGIAADRYLNGQWYTHSMLEIWGQQISDGTYSLFKSYPVCTFSGKLGPKFREGDGQTPEGPYTITPIAFNPSSTYRLSFNVGYPNAFDKSLGRTGGSVMVHGFCLSVGCLAMNDGIDEIYTIVSTSAMRGSSAIPLHIFPFPMTDGNIDLALSVPSLQQHSDFWKMIQPIWAAFETNHVPPAVQTLTNPARYKLN